MSALPVSIPPRPGESIESWLEHLADANGLATAQLLHLIRRDAGTRYLTLAPSPETIARLTVLTRVSEHQIRSATLAAYDGIALDLTGLDPDDRHSYRHVAARGWTPAHGTQLCPTCLAETGTWKLSWRLLLVTSCTTHALVLLGRCPSCRRPFRDQRHSHLRLVGAAPICGNPVGAGPLSQCPQDLAVLEATPMTPAAGFTQGRIDAALSRQSVPVLGQPSAPGQYLTDLRHLTTLMLHLAGQPGATSLAPWVDQLEPAAAQRTSARGPRWGLRPPDDTRVRAGVLTSADEILAAPDLDTAATLLTPWTELTPTTNDGPFGWLADRTVMTPTLTRLVIAARTPHRRLSHLLDSRSSGEDIVDIDQRQIPQLIPQEPYLRHLHGTIDSRAETVRLFASLSLARLHPDVTTWDAAAQALGMPGPMGSSCARACSARMRLSPTEWHARILRAAASLDTRDYRTLEAKILHRRDLSRWFTEWGRLYRPGTHYTSQPYGLTWQWIHVAQAHLDLSPAWNGGPLHR